jgi:hypothetical protein
MISRKAYLVWSDRERRRRGQNCESCGHSAGVLGQTRLHLHHLMSVHILGFADPSVMDAGNVLLLCNACHALFHPGYRFYDWFRAGQGRGRRLGQ